MKYKQSQSGTSLFEVLVAIVVIGITLISLISIVTHSISNSTFSKNRTRAAALTTEAVEWLRSQRDNDWTTFSGYAASTPGNDYCLRDLTLDPMPCAQIENIFTRTATLTTISVNGQDAVEIHVVTIWNEQDGIHESRATTTLTNWRL